MLFFCLFWYRGTWVTEGHMSMKWCQVLLKLQDEADSLCQQCVSVLTFPSFRFILHLGHKVHTYRLSIGTKMPAYMQCGIYFACGGLGGNPCFSTLVAFINGCHFLPECRHGQKWQPCFGSGEGDEVWKWWQYATVISSPQKPQEQAHHRKINRQAWMSQR